jgi:hypothetical protein
MAGGATNFADTLYTMEYNAMDGKLKPEGAPALIV